MITELMGYINRQGIAQVDVSSGPCNGNNVAEGEYRCIILPCPDVGKGVASHDEKKLVTGKHLFEDTQGINGIRFSLTPNLGVVDYKNFRSFVVADIPGLIEGAHHGAGLGHRFLKHVERNRLLLHILDLSLMPDRDPIRDYESLNRELQLFDEELAKKPQIVVVNKIDLPHVRENLVEVAPYFDAKGIRLFPISSATGEGIPVLLDEIAARLWGDSQAPRLP